MVAVSDLGSSYLNAERFWLCTPVDMARRSSKNSSSLHLKICAIQTRWQRMQKDQLMLWWKGQSSQIRSAAVSEISRSRISRKELSPYAECPMKDANFCGWSST